VRREVWEHPALYAAPLTVAGLILLGFLLSALGPPKGVSVQVTMSPALQAASHGTAYHIAAWAITVTSIVVGLFYALSALHTERRDRSILFWKSMPVSNLITVAAKAFVPLALLPALAFAIIIGLQLIMLAIAATGLMLHGLGLSDLWMQVDLFRNGLAALYTLVVVTLWYAPIYAWALLVSGWAKRAPFLWAVLPPLALMLVEQLALGTSHAAGVVMDRLSGFSAALGGAASPEGASFDPLSRLTPMAFITSPGLWGGLAVAGLLLAAAVWLRRRRESI
jgi:ABC-2 type transport system permease protein